MYKHSFAISIIFWFLDTCTHRYTYRPLYVLYISINIITNSHVFWPRTNPLSIFDNLIKTNWNLVNIVASFFVHVCVLLFLRFTSLKMSIANQIPPSYLAMIVNEPHKWSSQKLQTTCSPHDVTTKQEKKNKYAEKKQNKTKRWMSCSSNL